MMYLHQASPPITNGVLRPSWDFPHLLALGCCAPGTPAQHQLCPHKGLNGRLERAQWQGYVRMSSEPDSPTVTLLRGCGGLREAERSFSTVPLAASCTQRGWVGSGTSAMVDTRHSSTQSAGQVLADALDGQEPQAAEGPQNGDPGHQGLLSKWGLCESQCCRLELFIAHIPVTTGEDPASA